MLRAWLANKFIGFGRKMGRGDGREIMVDLSEHSIHVQMADPDDENLAWDDSLYKYGNVFLEGYANPIKPTVERHDTLDKPDRAELDAGDESGAQDDSADADDGHVKLISSARFGEFMRQQLIESLLNPREQWRLLMYGIIAVGALQIMTWAILLWATGSF